MQESSKSPRGRVRAGLLMFRRTHGALEVLLVHPGGPFFAKKDDGVWTIPKGETAPGEDLLMRAQIEFEEELGIQPSGDWIPLEWFKLKSNMFELEWPPRSGKLKKFPEIDQAVFFSEELARRKINPAQVPFLDRLRAALSG